MFLSGLSRAALRALSHNMSVGSRPTTLVDAGILRSTSQPAKRIVTQVCSRHGNARGQTRVHCEFRFCQRRRELAEPKQDGERLAKPGVWILVTGAEEVEGQSVPFGCVKSSSSMTMAWCVRLVDRVGVRQPQFLSWSQFFFSRLLIPTVKCRGYLRFQPLIAQDFART